MIPKIYILFRRGNIYGPFLSKEEANIASFLKSLEDRSMPGVKGSVCSMSLTDFKNFKWAMKRNPSLDIKAVRKLYQRIRQRIATNKSGEPT